MHEEDINTENEFGPFEYKRGEVYAPELFDQRLLFIGMEYHRKITPTDIDLFIDFGGHLFIYGEAKRSPHKLTTGQKKALVHLVDSHNSAGHEAIAIFFQHEVDAPISVYVKDLNVVMFYWKGSWIVPKKQISVHNLIIHTVNWCNSKNILI
jgi:hypothetical protein